MTIPKVVSVERTVTGLTPRAGTSACPPIAAWAVAALAVMAGIVAALSARRYGYYYDELYFIAAANGWRSATSIKAP
jgi:hypothetical protein